MTRGSPITRMITTAQRAQFHIRMQVKYGHYIPTKPRTYRAERRNALRGWRGNME